MAASGYVQGLNIKLLHLRIGKLGLIIICFFSLILFCSSHLLYMPLISTDGWMSNSFFLVVINFTIHFFCLNSLLVVLFNYSNFYYSTTFFFFNEIVEIIGHFTSKLEYFFFGTNGAIIPLALLFVLLIFRLLY